MYYQKINATVNIPTATSFSCVSQFGIMFIPQLLTLFILLPTNLANNSSCVSFSHKCFLVLDCFACVAFDFNCYFTFINMWNFLSMRRMPKRHEKMRL